MDRQREIARAAHQFGMGQGNADAYRQIPIEVAFLGYERESDDPDSPGGRRRR